MVVMLCISTAACFKSDGSATKETVDITDNASEPSEQEENEEPAEPAAKINLDALKEIEAKDKFDVKITKKELIADAYSGISISGNDACTFTIQNNTSSAVTEVTIYAVAYMENEGLMELTWGTYTIGQGNQYVQAFTTEDVTIEAGKSEKVSVKCRKDDIAGVQAIVAEYKTADGTTYENSAAEEWYENVQIGKVSQID